MKNKNAEQIAHASPCAGCPPGCDKCVFVVQGEKPTGKFIPILTAKQYGCVKGFGAVGHVGKILGQIRNGLFHPVGPTGAKFLRESGNALAEHLAT